MKVFHRRYNLNRYFQLFVVAAVATIILTRLFLFSTGYPKLGGDSALHIAHMLWGGLLMLVAIVIDIVFIDPRLFKFRVILSGIGFGLFIDELGKFITADNDYFFRPTFSIVYLLFILLVFITRRIYDTREYSREEIELNETFGFKQPDKGDIEVDVLDRAESRLNLVLRKFTESRFFNVSIVMFAAVEIFKVVISAIVIAILFYSDGIISGLELGVAVLSAVFATTITVFLLIGIAAAREDNVKEQRNFRRASTLSLLTVQVLIFSASNLAGLIYLLLGLGFYSLLELRSQATPAADKPAS